MEKQRIKSIIRSFTGLLVLLFTSSLYGQTLTYAMIKQLRITPVEDQMFYTRNDIKFEVTIPYVSPNQIDITIPSDEENVMFKILRKTEDFDGTKIELWYNFSKKGNYRLNPLELKIKNIQRTIKFADIQIKLNPKEQTPQIVVEFPDNIKVYSEDISPSKPVYTARVGEKFKISVYLQYSVHLLNYHWDLPKNSIFTKKESYEITNIRLRDVVASEKLIPVWDFEWTVLKPGIVDFPQFVMTVTGYNGVKSEISFPQIKILAEDGEPKTEIIEKDYYQQSFEYLENESEKDEDEVDYTQTVSSLIKTKTLFKILFIISLVLFSIVLIILFVFMKRKKWNKCIFLAAFAICVLILSIFFYVKMNRRYGIVTDCILYSVPEKTANSISEIPSGSKVEVKQIADNWVFIEFGQMSGWCEESMVEVY